MTDLDQFLHLCSREISRRAAASDDLHDQLCEGAQALDAALSQAQARSAELDTVPVVDCLGEATPTPLLLAAQSALPEIRWVASPRMSDGGTRAALAPLNEVRDLPGVVCGLLVIAPGGSYPEHSHPPQELYLPITGSGQWRYGGSTGLRKLDDDQLVYNHPNDIHEVHAGDTPLLAMYVLWPA